MKQFITETCRVTVFEDGRIQVDYKETPKFSVNGVPTTIPGMSNNWWLANYAGHNWNLDLDLGVQRFNGITTLKRVKEALAVAGLSSKNINIVICAAKKHKHFSVGRL